MSKKFKIEHFHYTQLFLKRKEIFISKGLLKIRNFLFFYFLQIEAFIINTILWNRLPFSPPIYNTSQHFWAKEMRKFVMLLGEYFGCTLLSASSVHVAPSHCLSRISVPDFVHHHFWLRLLQEFGYLL
jgi:hypothetical protein